MTRAKYFLLALTITLIVSAIIAIERTKPARVTQTSRIVVSENSKGEILSSSQKESIDKKRRKFQPASELAGIHAFINTPKTSIADLVGKKVILVDFWTYSCINCQRTTPYLNAWYEKYKNKGLEIIGVHTPEFDFEKKLENVSAAVKKFSIAYPVALDNDYTTWGAYNNRYWPRKYLIDIDGYIVYDHIGEGGYEETEKKIQELLSERMSVLGMKETVTSEIAHPLLEETTNPRERQSPETYFGAARNELLGNGEQGAIGVRGFKEPVFIQGNTLYLDGQWDIQNEYAENKTTEAKIIYKYRAKNVYFVGGANMPTDIEVRLDDKPVTEEQGGDIKEKDAKTFTTIQEQRLYKLIKNSDYKEHTLELIIKNPGLQAFTFTFG